MCSIDLLRVHRTLTKKSLGNADSPSDGSRPRSAQRSILSRGLRMDNRKPSIPTIGPCEQVDADAVPIASGRENASVTYSGSAREVSAGFAVALCVMGFEAGIL